MQPLLVSKQIFKCFTDLLLFYLGCFSAVVCRVVYGPVMLIAWLSSLGDCSAVFLFLAFMLKSHPNTELGHGRVHTLAESAGAILDPVGLICCNLQYF